MKTIYFSVKNAGYCIPITHVSNTMSVPPNQPMATARPVTYVMRAFHRMMTKMILPRHHHFLVA
eukprot:scaffold248855_cov126-Cyclotella_meneghiniana.AAC.1